MATRPTGKQRATRIPLDYFKYRDRLTRIKLMLTGLALLAAVAWWASGLRPTRANPIKESDSSVMRYSHGPVANVHATWDARCEACHVSFKPIGEDSWTKLVGMNSAEAQKKCMACHKVEDHHQNQRKEDTDLTSCANCHRDHRGRDASLVRLPDSDCITCHGNLKSHSSDAKKKFHNITSFPQFHPEFALYSQKGKPTDPGKLKFSHARHLNKGMAEKPGEKPVWVVKQLSASNRARYQREGQSLEDGVQLDCASCHRLEAGNNAPRESLSNPLPGRGAYMQPISYQTDCAACHTLELSMTTGPRDADTKQIFVQHRLQPSALHDFLTNSSIGITMDKPEKLLEKFTPSRRSKPGSSNDSEQLAKEEVAARVKAAEATLFGGGKSKNTCTECHYFNVKGGAKEFPDKDLPFSSAIIFPTQVKTIWYEHANFDHSAHRAVSCKECHASAWNSTEEEDVMLPAKATCAQCHAPASRTVGGLEGGAGHSCTECHRYHGADHKRGPSMAKDDDAMGIARFLTGQ